VSGEKLKKILTSVTFRQFIVYIPLAGIATVVDWGSYYLLAKELKLNPILSVIISYTLGGLTNYSLNKIFNFRDKVKTIGFQMAVYGIIMGISYGLTALLMSIQIYLLSINFFIARIITTAIVLAYNFIMHKSFTFNEIVQGKIASFFNRPKL
jgi:putative flippase GtrA